MRKLVLALALIAVPAFAQEKKVAKPAPKKAPAEAQKSTVAKARSKPTPEQIMRFQDLEKKRQGK